MFDIMLRSVSCARELHVSYLAYGLNFILILYIVVLIFVGFLKVNKP